MKKKGLIIAIAIPILLSMPFYGAVCQRFLHVVGTVMFMGNLFVTAMWGGLAKRRGDASAMALAVRGIIVTDVAFTTPGALLLLLNGGLLGTPYFKAGIPPWLLVSLVLFLLAVVFWLALMVPLQTRMLRRVDQGEDILADFKRWFRWGGIVSLITLIVLVLMVFKPLLWSA